MGGRLDGRLNSDNGLALTRPNTAEEKRVATLTVVRYNITPDPDTGHDRCTRDQITTLLAILGLDTAQEQPARENRRSASQ